MVELRKAYPVDLAILEAFSVTPGFDRFEGTTSMLGFGLRACEGVLTSGHPSPSCCYSPLEVSGPDRDRP
jgi:hypothetical protein